MLQYLINATSIWVLSLIAFDALLRKETWHLYNRFYLLITLLLGAILPLLCWQKDIVSDITSSRDLYTTAPIHLVTSFEQNIITIAQPAHTTINYGKWIWLIYFIGVIVALLLLAIDIVKLIYSYWQGVKTKYKQWTMVETGRSHTPFSTFSYLFVGSRKRYSEEEWNMLLVHELQHIHQRHSLDLLLLQLTKIIFWFHPLVYLYNRRLVLVHEYQADNCSTLSLKEYCRFLVEQATLRQTPALLHSFNRSPISARITMLTRHSLKWTKSKYLIVIPLILCCIIFFTGNVFSSARKKIGNKIYYKGNVLETSEIDTVYNVYNSNVGKIETRYDHHAPAPVLLNSEKIRTTHIDENTDTSNDLILRNSERFNNYIIRSMTPLWEQLDDGMYNADAMYKIVNKNGELVYYEYQGVYKVPMILNNRNVSEPLGKAIDKKMIELLEHAPRLEIFYAGQTTAPYEIGGYLYINVKKHHLISTGVQN